ncbi:acyl-CoA dehydrogenase family protein [Actinoallomurus sp. CA-142502]|uniref:acyl-CoA dehydrogenase family protein n=1 Tax=Actinoallomurus sp. CA-142502 TaxID=3239885 RepID=UPI003D949574
MSTTPAVPDELLPRLRELVAEEIRPRADEDEAHSRFPRDLCRVLGKLGVLGLPYARELGGSGWRFEDYLQALEVLAGGWLTIAETVAVHTLACFPVAAHGDDAQRRELLPAMLGGELLGSYCLSEPGAGSDAASLTTKAVPDGGHFVVNGTKAWITHAGHADFYNLFVRTGGDGPGGISCLLADKDTPGLSPDRPEKKMGLTGSPVAQIHLNDARVPRERLVGELGRGFAIAMSALDRGRLGIAACAIGLSQAALDVATDYAMTRRQFGRPVGEFQAVAFMLADMATAIEAGRCLYRSAARRLDAGEDLTKEASMAKLFCTDTAMQVTTDAVQILGAVGYTDRYPVERYMREAKVLQIFEGTNQIQRLVISRRLTAERRDAASAGR